MAKITSTNAESYYSQRAYNTFVVDGVTYDVNNAFKMGDFVLYLCSNGGLHTEVKYCYILFSDAAAENESKQVELTTNCNQNDIKKHIENSELENFSRQFSVNQVKGNRKFDKNNKKSLTSGR